MDADGDGVRTLSERTGARRADSRARHVGRGDTERKDHPLVGILRPADGPALWPGLPVHRVDRAVTVLGARGVRFATPAQVPRGANTNAASSTRKFWRILGATSPAQFSIPLKGAMRWQTTQPCPAPGIST